MPDETPGRIIVERLYSARNDKNIKLTKEQTINIVDGVIKELKLRRPKKMFNGRNVMFDALCVACGINPNDVTESQGGNIGTALSEISAVSPDLNAEELQLRANKYRSLYPDIAITPSGLAAHWGECWAGEKKQVMPTNEPTNWREVLTEMCQESEWSAASIKSLVDAGWERVPLGLRTNVIRRIQSKTANDSHRKIYD